MKDIKPYITVRSEVCGLPFIHYLHIHGGAGGFHRKNIGGEYDFILFYASVGEMEGLDKCERLWCKEKGIIYGEGDSIEKAHADYFKKATNLLQASKNGQK
jgi:hypothetical protein